MEETDSSLSEYQLLRRPNSLPDFSQSEPGLNAWWNCKYFYYKHRSELFPRANINVRVQIKFSKLIIRGLLLRQKLKISLVSIGYIESSEKRRALDVRGVSFRLMMFGVDDVDETRDRLRFLVVRQRVPHCILKLPFDWQKRESDSHSTENELLVQRLRNLCCCCVRIVE